MNVVPARIPEIVGIEANVLGDHRNQAACGLWRV